MLKLKYEGMTDKQPNSKPRARIIPISPMPAEVLVDHKRPSDIVEIMKISEYEAFFSLITLKRKTQNRSKDPVNPVISSTTESE